MDTVKLGGALSSRGARPLGDFCGIDRAISLVGKRTTMLLLREAFYGERRFDGFAARTGMTEAATAKRLKELVAAGLLSREPYQERGQRTRHEYVLTEMGAALLPVVLGLLRWGNEYVEPGLWSDTRLSHTTCGREVTVVVRCSAGHDVPASDLTVSSSPLRQFE